MSRRKKYISANNRYLQLIEKLDSFQETPFSEISENLKECLLDGDQAVRLNILDSNSAKRLQNSIYRITELFPNRFDDRFWFDYWMIDGIAESFNNNGQVLTGMLIPRYDEEWAHISRITPMGRQHGQTASINFICFPAEENVAHIDLLSYPFLLHELGHNLFFYKEEIFTQRFETELQTIVGALKRRAISDIGTAKTKSTKQLQQLIGLWTPRPNQKDWAHETLVDLIALWSCGPAYLASFLDEMEDDNKNPYLIASVHPPYAFRTNVLLKASKKLGWEKYTRGLKEVLIEWEKSHWSKAIDNNYHAMTNDKLRDAILNASFETFVELKLPQCEKTNIEQIRKKLDGQKPLEWGVEIILGAWLYREEYTPINNEQIYEKWEQTLIKNKLESLTQ